MPTSQKTRKNTHGMSLATAATLFSIIVPIFVAFILGLALIKQSLIYKVLGINLPVEVSDAAVALTGFRTAGVVLLFIFAALLPILYFYSTIEVKGAKKVQKAPKSFLAPLLLPILLIPSASNKITAAIMALIMVGILLAICVSMANSLHRFNHRHMEGAVSLATYLKFIGVTLLVLEILSLIIVGSSMVGFLSSKSNKTLVSYENKKYLLVSKEDGNFLLSEVCNSAKIKFGSFRFVPIDKISVTESKAFKISKDYC